ncbi:MAG: hypothetical protein JKY53_00020 [Flavobacteriales bacterium]|nr:hypothetical protein [Flavobacteriales bacterium]
MDLIVQQRNISEDQSYGWPIFRYIESNLKTNRIDGKLQKQRKTSEDQSYGWQQIQRNKHASNMQTAVVSGTNTEISVLDTTR